MIESIQLKSKWHWQIVHGRGGTHLAIQGSQGPFKISLVHGTLEKLGLYREGTMVEPTEIEISGPQYRSGTPDWKGYFRSHPANGTTLYNASFWNQL